ncbi:MAG: ABC transporter substrate-binding protein [Burkholderiales bacterium]|nr:ABC transporter substrate-binding protein [Burkholderiales bacterium]
MRAVLRALLLGVLVACSAVAATAAEGPDVVIKRAVDEAAAALLADREIQAGNRQKLNALVDAKIVPYLNFQRMTQAAVGRHWGRATAEQQQSLMREFKALLTNTYAGAFTAYRADTVIEYRPLRMQAGDSEAVVRSLVKPKNGEPIQLDYYVERFDGAWKVVDINVLGARLVQTYQGQFNTEISANGIDGLIKALGAKNRAIEARSRS